MPGLTGSGPEIPFKGLIEEANEDTEATSEGSEEVEQEEDSETEDKIENRKFLMAWNVRPISVKNLSEEKIQNFEEIEDELKIELSKFGKSFRFLNFRFRGAFIPPGIWPI